MQEKDRSGLDCSSSLPKPKVVDDAEIDDAENLQSEGRKK
jgi:hypothetical protein